MGAIEYVAIGFGGLACMAAVYLDFFRGTVRLLPALGVFLSGLLFQFRFTGTVAWENLGLNLGFLVMMFLMAFLALKATKGQPLFKEGIGLGDLAMFLGPLAWLDAPGFAIYIVSALVLVLGQILIQRARSGGAPVVGRFSGILAVWLLAFAPVYWHYAAEIRILLEG